MHKRKDSSKNRLFKKIKISLEEKSGNLKRTNSNYKFHLEHVNNINLKPLYKKTLYNEINRIHDNLKNITDDEQIKNKMIDISNNYSGNNLNFTYNGNKIKKLFINKKSSDYIKICNNENDINLMNYLYQNNKIYYINKLNSKDNLVCELKNKKTNNSINNNNFNKEYFNNYNINQNIMNKRTDKNIIIKRVNNYRTLFERQKEKNEHTWNNRNENNINHFQDNLNNINLKKNNLNNLNMKISLHKKSLSNKNMVGNINQKQFKKNNIYINNSINKFHRNMKVSASANDIIKDLLNHNKILSLSFLKTESKKNIKYNDNNFLFFHNIWVIGNSPWAGDSLGNILLLSLILIRNSIKLIIFSSLFNIEFKFKLLKVKY